MGRNNRGKLIALALAAAFVVIGYISMMRYLASLGEAYRNLG